MRSPGQSHPGTGKRAASFVAVCRPRVRVGSPQFEGIEREESLDDEVEKAGLAWRAKAAEILSRNSDASISDMPLEMLKAFQKYIHLRAENLRRLAAGKLHDKSLEEAMLEVQRYASTCTPECLAKAMELLRNSSVDFCAQHQI